MHTYMYVQSRNSVGSGHHTFRFQSWVEVKSGDMRSPVHSMLAMHLCNVHITFVCDNIVHT